MKDQTYNDLENGSYGRTFEVVEKAIHYILEAEPYQPGLEELAEKLGLSPAYVQKIFSRWAGVSPKTFGRYLALQKARKSLRLQATLFDAAHDAGLSGTGRLHDLFVQIEAMTPGTFKEGGTSLTIRYSTHTTLFGRTLFASTPKGICQISFEDDEMEAVARLQESYPNAEYQQETDEFQQAAMALLNGSRSSLKPLPLHLRGTPFQVNVWEALLKIPEGSTSTYGTLARSIGKPGAARAVGTAIGQNPVAWVIPCHRVLRSTGAIGGYRWGTPRKRAMLVREQICADQESAMRKEIE